MFKGLKQLVSTNIKWYSTKLSYKHCIGSEPLRYITLGKLLEEAANKYPNRDAVISVQQNKSVTFGQALIQADKLAAGFRSLGLEKNDRLGIWAPNLLEWYLTFMAGARIGLIMVALNPAYQPPEMEYCINKVNLKALVCGDTYKDENLYQHLLKIAPNLEHSKPGNLKNSKVSSLSTLITVGNTGKPGTYNYDEVLDLANQDDVRKIQKIQESISPDDPLSIQFTSGTTGKPKAVLLTHFKLLNNAQFFGKRLEMMSKHHTMCVQAPFFHAIGVIGSILASLCYGCTMVLPSITYNSNKALDSIRDHRCTLLIGTPTMYADLIHNQERRNEDVSPEIALIGGAPSSPTLRNKMFEVLGLKKVKSACGLTEATGAVFTSLINEDMDKVLTTVGHVQDHFEVKVVDKEGQVVPYGTEGELCVRGYGNMLKYWGDEQETKRVLGQGGWLKTGDQFILHEDGYGQIVGRAKEMIIRGGENIHPQEIDDFLSTHPDILEVYVIGLPHERLGEEVCACVKIKSGATLTLEGISSFCQGQISNFKIPSKLEIMQEFPKTESGKIQKFKLRELLLNSIKHQKLSSGC